MPGKPLIVAEGLTKTFVSGGEPAIDNLTACVKSGGVTGLVGPDGAGKTTLLRLFAGLLLPDSGRVSVCGFDTRTQFAELTPLDQLHAPAIRTLRRSLRPPEPRSLRRSPRSRRAGARDRPTNGS